jgi:CubicO group peptidase (beta-lactamase class C family)
MNNQALQSLLDETAAELGVVGAQLALYDGNRMREFVTGWRYRELGLPVTGETLFQIGSTTKVFNAALIMSLVDEGCLDLDVPVITYVPEFRLASLEAQGCVTLRHLLSMSAGIDNGPYNDYGRGDDALERYVISLAGIPHIFEPGTAFGYSNASTCVAGYVASCVARRSWEALLAERILRPLGLGQSAMHAENLLAHPVALGYLRHSPGEPAQRMASWALPRCIAPAGGTLCSSASDLVRFACMFLQGGQSDAGTRVLSEAAIDVMHASQVKLPTELMAQHWCVGPYRKTWGGYKIYGHSGTNLGGSSMLLWCPERRIAIATTVNVANQGYPLAERIFDIVFPDLFGIEKPKAPNRAGFSERSAHDLLAFTGRYEAFGAVMRIVLQDGLLQGVYDADVLRTLGLQSVLESELISIGNWRFIPRNPAFSGNRCWDIAFWDESGGGRPTHLLNGMFAMRRTG